MSSRLGRAAASPYTDDEPAYTKRRTPASRAATSMVRVAVALLRCEEAGSSTERATLGTAASW